MFYSRIQSWPLGCQVTGVEGRASVAVPHQCRPSQTKAHSLEFLRIGLNVVFVCCF